MDILTNRSIIDLRGTLEDTEKACQDLLMKIQRDKLLTDYTFPEHPGKDGFYYIWVKDMTARNGSPANKCQ